MQENQVDLELIEATKKGDSRAFDVLVLRYQSRIFKIVARFVRDPSEILDVCQEVFIKAYRNIQSFDTSQKFSPWIYRIAHNECINFLKKKRLETVSLSVFELDTFLPHMATHKTPETELEKQDILKLLDAGLNKLDTKYREPLVLYYIEELDYKDIADVLQIPTATVGVRLNRAKKLLKEQYKSLTTG